MFALVGRLARTVTCFAAFALGASTVLGTFAAAGCSSSDAARPKCDPTTCQAGSDCIADSCKKLCTRQKDCPSGSYCNDATPQSWCELTTLPVPANPVQFGAPCRGLASCDKDHGFACYASGTTDAAAFCTRLNCGADSDCPGGWWCALVNEAPNIATDNRTFGPTLRWCLPREYCAPCKADHDCQAASPSSGAQKHCVADANGAGYCAPQCASNTNCPLDARCTPRWTVCGAKPCTTAADCPPFAGVAEGCFAGTCKLACASDGDCARSSPAPQRCDSGACVGAACASDDDCPPAAGTFQHCNAGACAPECGAAADCTADQVCQALSVCSPRAGTCVGDGSLCSPCQSDDDCMSKSAPVSARGYCIDTAPYSTERFCSQPIAGGGKCSTTGPPQGGCPSPRAGSARIACTTTATSVAPADQCIGSVVFGTSAGTPQGVPGCWTPSR